MAAFRILQESLHNIEKHARASAVKVRVVTLEVTPDQSEKVALASRHGVIQLTMRSRVDQQFVPTAGTTPLALLMPDEGVEEARGVEPVKVAAKRRTRSRKPKAAKPAKPEQPVVEILRGGRVEQRKLRPSADSN